MISKATHNLVISVKDAEIEVLKNEITKLYEDLRDKHRLDDTEVEMIRSVRKSMKNSDGFLMKSPYALTDGEIMLVEALRKATISKIPEYGKTVICYNIDNGNTRLYRHGDSIVFVTDSMDTECDKEIIDALKQIQSEQRMKRR